METSPVVRAATETDLAAINRIYNHFIFETHVSFDTEPWSADKRAAWFEHYSTTGRYRVLVAEQVGGVIGMSYSSPFRHKRAYDTSVETTIVLDPDAVGRGTGTLLLGSLIEILEHEDVHRAYAVVALPNDASIALHRKLGYRSVGVQHEVGRKFGRYWSTELLERPFS